ncbi:MAG: hypothetical protein P8Y70_20280 [Candidatus Lokiarchaeota archaeon]
MQSSNYRTKQAVLSKFLNSGINLTPSILDFILSLKDPLEKSNLIITKTSFMPEFKSHLTIAKPEKNA